MSIKYTFIVLLIAYLDGILSGSTLCPCEDVSLCQTVNRTGNEIYAFVLKSNRSVWSLFDWSKLTTIALADFYDPELMCFAHQNQVRVVMLADYPKSDLRNNTKISQWIDNQIQFAKDRFLDGINIDIEYDIDKNSNLVEALSHFTARVAESFHTAIPGSQVTFDVPWSPYNSKGTGIDGRNYNFIEIARATDFLFVMSYDEQSQIFGDECTARANSGLFMTSGGIMAYLNMGIDANKLVLGLPWYGYDYNCTSTGPERKCYIAKVPFRGVNCSDAAGRQLPYNEIYNLSLNYSSNYDQHSESVFLYFNDTNNITRQIWYDDSETLSQKITFATYKKLRGIGIWNANTLDYSGTSSSKAMIADMWGTFPDYKTMNEMNNLKIKSKINITDINNK